MVRIDPEPVRVFGPGLIDGLERGFAVKRYEVLGEVVGRDEGQDMRLQALQIFVVEDLDGASLMVGFMRSACPLVQGW